jgi:hypothetical protein
MKRRKPQKGRLGEAESPSAEVTPPIPQQVISSPEVLPTDLPIIDVSLISRASEVPKGLNHNDMIVIVTGDSERTANLERLIWSSTGLIAIGVGSISAVVIFVSHYRVAGSVGLATAAVGGIMSLVARIRLRKKRGSN